MTELKIGDRVTVDLDSPNSSWHKAEGYVIEERAAPDSAMVRITKAGPNCASHLGRERTLYNLTKLGAKHDNTAFKVGDRVKVATNAPHGGRVGKVTSLSGRSLWPYEVTYEGEFSMQTGIFSAKELGRVPTEAPKPDFKVGDFVTFAEPLNNHWQGGKGKIVPSDSSSFGKYTARVEILEGPPLNTIYKEGGHTINFNPEHLKPFVEPKLPELFGYSKGGIVSKPEAVDGPAHYGGKDNPYEVIKVAEAWGFEKNAYLFNALKYLGRAGKKVNKVEDLKKLKFYVDREIALEEAK